MKLRIFQNDIIIISVPELYEKWIFFTAAKGRNRNYGSSSRLWKLLQSLELKKPFCKSNLFDIRSGNNQQKSAADTSYRKQVRHPA